VGSFVLPLTKGHCIQLGNAIPAFPDETDMPVLFNKGHFIQLGNTIPAFPDETDMPVLFYLPIPGSLTAAFLK
jgi:hypothetical protein